MAPEQAAGQGKEIGPGADVYSLGAILYECLTGRPPFRATTSAETMMQVLTDDPLPVRQLQPGLGHVEGVHESSGRVGVDGGRDFLNCRQVPDFHVHPHLLAEVGLVRHQVHEGRACVRCDSAFGSALDLAHEPSASVGCSMFDREVWP